MYRSGEGPRFCQHCGASWNPGATVCTQCNEPIAQVEVGSNEVDAGRLASAMLAVSLWSVVVLVGLVAPFNTETPLDPWLVLLSRGVALAVAVGLCIHVRRVLGGLAEVRWRGSMLGMAVALWLGAVVCGIGWEFMLVEAMGVAASSFVFVHESHLLQSTPLAVLSLAVAVTTEELLLRGPQFGLFRQFLGVHASAWLGGLVLAMMQFPWLYFPLWLIFGWVLGLVRERYGSVLPGLFARLLVVITYVGIMSLG